MAFKQPLSRGVTRHRPAHRESASFTRESNGRVRLRIPRRLIEQARLDTDSVDVFVGSGKDAGLVRIRPGNSFRLSTNRGDNIFYLMINPNTVAGFDQSSERITASEAKVASISAPARSLSLHAPDGFLEG